MKKKIKSYLVFSSFSYKVCIFLLMPAVLVGIGIGIVSIFGELGLTVTAMLLTMAVILSDHWLFSGLMAKDLRHGNGDHEKCADIGSAAQAPDSFWNPGGL